MTGKPSEERFVNREENPKQEAHEHLKNPKGSGFTSTFGKVLDNISTQEIDSHTTWTSASDPRPAGHLEIHIVEHMLNLYIEVLHPICVKTMPVTGWTDRNGLVVHLVTNPDDPKKTQILNHDNHYSLLLPKPGHNTT